MRSLLCLWLALAAADELPWQDLSFTISADPYVSSDTATLCRVRVVNNGTRTWRGDRIRFEAEALEGGAVADRARGRFGLTLGPRETLETVIAFSGRYDRFSVRPLPKDSGKRETPRKGKRSTGGRKSRKKR